ncbi:cytochrome c1 [Imbroritus primus]|uniref:Cytochrome c1 n=1 Tax=Imbroritus primus TaxID=3058603 RepID=A0ACD3SSL0_9BURK|nr:cytochrome c1 [Burkholderiaceae bacterium PBA]
MKKLISMIALAGALIGAPAIAAESGHPLDAAPKMTSDLSTLQRGAKLFVNNCLNCHSASMVRYNRLKDIGLTEDQIRENLLFSADKVGETMNIAMTAKEAKAWFGVQPPDLSVIARARGGDWLYTYLRSFYKDDTRDTGWNNLIFPNVGMPHVMWEAQGIRKAKFEERADAHDASKTVHTFVGYEQVTPGTMKPIEFDQAMGDLVHFLQWMGEPAEHQRKRLGVWVLMFLGLFSILAWRLNASYWKDIK